MKKDIALVLSGGGARGLAHIGVIRELERRGYHVTALAGTSIGSLVGAAYAYGCLDKLERFLTSLDRDEVARLMDFTLSERGLVKGNRLFTKLHEVLPDCRIEDLPVPLTIVASDLTSGKERVYTRGNVYEAMRASMAIPGLLTAVNDHKHMLVDGGILNPLPLNRVVRAPGNWLFAVNLYAVPEPDFVPLQGGTVPPVLADAGWMYKVRRGWDGLKAWRGGLMGRFLDSGDECDTYTGILKRAVGLMMLRMAEQAIALERPDVVVPVPITAAGPLDFHKSAALVALGKQRAAKALDAFEVEASRSGFSYWWKKQYSRFSLSKTGRK